MKLSVIVPAIDASDVVFPAVEQVHRSQADHAEVLILCATSMPPDRVGRLQAMWRPSLVRCVTVADESPGAVRNAGIASSSGELIMFLEPGDTISPGVTLHVADMTRSRNHIPVSSDRADVRACRDRSASRAEQVGGYRRRDFSLGELLVGPARRADDRSGRPPVDALQQPLDCLFALDLPLRGDLARDVHEDRVGEIGLTLMRQAVGTLMARSRFHSGF